MSDLPGFNDLLRCSTIISITSATSFSWRGSFGWEYLIISKALLYGALQLLLFISENLPRASATITSQISHCCLAFCFWVLLQFSLSGLDSIVFCDLGFFAPEVLVPLALVPPLFSRTFSLELCQNDSDWAKWKEIQRFVILAVRDMVQSFYQESESILSYVLITNNTMY